MELEEFGKLVWFRKLGTVIVATEDGAGTYRDNVAGGSVARNFDCCLVSRDFVEVVSMLKNDQRISIGTSQAGAAGAQSEDMRNETELAQQEPKKLPGESGGKGESRFQERRKGIQCVVIAVVHSA